MVRIRSNSPTGMFSVSVAYSIILIYAFYAIVFYHTISSNFLRLYTISPVEDCSKTVESLCSLYAFSRRRFLFS